MHRRSIGGWRGSFTIAVNTLRAIMPHAEPRHVFVYGTLRRGGRNDINRLQPAPVYVGTAAVQGRLYLIDWYPGLTLGGDSCQAITGEVYRIDAALEAVLDAIEGIEPGPDSEYAKREVEVAVGGRSLRCLVYEIHPDRTRGKPLIDPGDWMRFHPD